MLLPKDINPINTVYYNGAIAIQAMNSMNVNKIDFLDLYSKLKESHDLSIQSFILALDWLFIVGSIKQSGEGEIEKCF